MASSFTDPVNTAFFNSLLLKICFKILMICLKIFLYLYSMFYFSKENETLRYFAIFVFCFGTFFLCLKATLKIWSEIGGRRRGTELKLKAGMN